MMLRVSQIPGMHSHIPCCVCMAIKVRFVATMRSCSSTKVTKLPSSCHPYTSQAPCAVGHRHRSGGGAAVPEHPAHAGGRARRS